MAHPPARSHDRLRSGERSRPRAGAEIGQPKCGALLGSVYIIWVPSKSFGNKLDDLRRQLSAHSSETAYHVVAELE